MIGGEEREKRWKKLEEMEKIARAQRERAQALSTQND